MSLTLLGHNSLEAGTVTVSPAAAAGKPITRIFDRQRALQYEGGSAAQTDIDIDLGASPPSVSAWALVNHNVTGVVVSLFGAATFPPTTLRDSALTDGSDFVLTFASLMLRYWRLRIPAMTPVPKLGEVMLGAARTVSQNPFIDNSAIVTRTNIQRDQSPAGYTWASRKGPHKTVLPYGWTSLAQADVVALQNLVDDIQDGAKNFLLKDVLGTLRWMQWTDPELSPVPLGAGQYRVDAFTLVEAL